MYSVLLHNAGRDASHLSSGTNYHLFPYNTCFLIQFGGIYLIGAYFFVGCIFFLIISICVKVTIYSICVTAYNFKCILI